MGRKPKIQLPGYRIRDNGDGSKGVEARSILDLVNGLHELLTGEVLSTSYGVPFGVAGDIYRQTLTTCTNLKHRIGKSHRGKYEPMREFNVAAVKGRIVGYTCTGRYQLRAAMLGHLRGTPRPYDVVHRSGKQPKNAPNDVDLGPYIAPIASRVTDYDAVTKLVQGDVDAWINITSNEALRDLTYPIEQCQIRLEQHINRTTAAMRL